MGAKWKLGKQAWLDPEAIKLGQEYCHWLLHLSANHLLLHLHETRM